MHVGRLEPMNRFTIHVGRLESLRRFTTAALIRCVDSGRPTRIALPIRGGRRPTRIGGSIQVGDSNRGVDSRRPTCIPASIHIGRRESMRRFRNRYANSSRTARIARSILVGLGRLIQNALEIRFCWRESLCRFSSADLNRCVDARRPT